MDLTSKDLEILENFSVALGRQFYIGTKNKGKTGEAWRIQFSDTGYYDLLLSVGLTPSKSHTMSDLAIPDRYFQDFLRGSRVNSLTYAKQDSVKLQQFMYGADPKLYLTRKRIKLETFVDTGKLDIII